MPRMFTVPESVKATVQRALSLHAEFPLADVTGVKIAEELSAGTIPIDTLSILASWFKRNNPAYVRELKEFKTESDSAVVRSWLLHGAEVGMAWVASEMREAVAYGFNETDPVDSLFEMEPEEIYSRFAVNGWRIDYDLTLAKAARFVEDYMRSTGKDFDIPKAFGESAPAVANAIYRRLSSPNAFKTVMKALTVEDEDLRIAAHRDLAEMNYSIDAPDALEESLFPKASRLTAQAVAKFIWAPFVGYFILACDKPELIKDLNQHCQLPPGESLKPKLPSAYNDAVNTYVMYFNTYGKHYISSAGDKKFDGIGNEVFTMLTAAKKGHKLQPVKVKKMLGRCRIFLAQHKLAGSFFHILNAAWNKGDWAFILSKMPIDSDVYEPFKAFAEENPLPSHGVKLQQTLSDKGQLKIISDFLTNNKYKEATDPMFPTVKVNDTELGVLAQTAGTPLGVYSKVNIDGNDAVFLGAFKAKNGKSAFVFKLASTGALFADYDDYLCELFKVGHVQVLQGHHELPGTLYANKTISKSAAPEEPVPVAPVAEPKTEPVPAPVTHAKIEPELTSGILNFLDDEFGEEAVKQFLAAAVTTTLSYAASMEVFKSPLKTNSVLKKKKNGDLFSIQAVYQIHNVTCTQTDADGNEEEVEVNDTIIVMKGDDNELNAVPDETLAQLIKSGKLELVNPIVPVAAKPALQPGESLVADMINGPTKDYIVKSCGLDSIICPVPPSVVAAASKKGFEIKAGNPYTFTSATLKPLMFAMCVKLASTNSINQAFFIFAKTGNGANSGFDDFSTNGILNRIQIGDMVPYAAPAPATEPAPDSSTLIAALPNSAVKQYLLGEFPSDAKLCPLAPSVVAAATSQGFSIKAKAGYQFGGTATAYVYLFSILLPDSNKPLAIFTAGIDTSFTYFSSDFLSKEISNKGFVPFGKAPVAEPVDTVSTPEPTTPYAAFKNYLANNNLTVCDLPVGVVDMAMSKGFEFVAGKEFIVNTNPAKFHNCVISNAVLPKRYLVFSHVSDGEMFSVLASMVMADIEDDNLYPADAVPASKTVPAVTGVTTLDNANLTADCEAYIKGMGFDLSKLITCVPSETPAGIAAAGKSFSLRVGKMYNDDDLKEELKAVFYDPAKGIISFLFMTYSEDGTDFSCLTDSYLKALINKGKFTPYVSKDTVATPEPEPVVSDEPLFNADSVVEYDGYNWYIVARSNAAPYMYLMYPMKWDTEANHKLHAIPEYELTNAATSVIMAEPNVSQFKKMFLSNGYLLAMPQSSKDSMDSWGVYADSIIKLGSKKVNISGVVSKGDEDNQPLFFCGVMPTPSGYNTEEYWLVFVGDSGVFNHKVSSSYEPPEMKPEKGSEDALADEEIPGVPAPAEMCGTFGAIEFMKEKGYVPCTQKANSSFIYKLGAKLKYKGNKTRTIIGYCTSSFGPIYIMTTEAGNMNWKTTVKGNVDYGPVICMVQEVIDALLPVPGASAEKGPLLPKLNYPLTDKAKAWSKENSTLFVPAPHDAAYYVGTKLHQSTEEGSLWFRLSGWIEDEGLKAVLIHDIDNVSIVSNEVLAEAWFLHYEHHNKIDEDTGEATFGKAGDNAKLTITTDTGSTTTDDKLPDGWDLPPSVKQPGFLSLPKGQHVSAGIVIVVPPGSSINNKSQILGLKSTLVVMVHPMNDFGGYTLTYPKGTVEKGESLEATAVREVWEETGISCKPVAFLGDFEGGSSVTRMYIGYITGGNPHTAGKETDAVTLKPLFCGDATTAWTQTLKTRDKKITDAAAEWIKTNGVPSANLIDTSEYDSAPTGPQDLLGGPQYDNTKEVECEVFGAINYVKGAKIDYEVSGEVKDYLKELPIQWTFMKAWPMVQAGYPPTGVAVKYEGTEYTVSAYTVYVLQVSGTASDIKAFYDKLGILSIICRSVVLVDATKNVSQIVVDCLDPAEQSNESKHLVRKKPEDFDPVIQQQGDSATIQANTDADDIWNSIYKKSLVPLSNLLVNELKRKFKATDYKDKLSAIYVMKAGVGGPAYAHWFKVAEDFKYVPGKEYAGVSLFSMAYIEFVFENTPSSMKTKWILAMTEAEGPAVVNAYDMSKFTLDSETTLKSKMADAWFHHPDHVVNEAFKTLYANGCKLESVGVTMQILKNKWLKEAGVPYYSVVSYGILQPLCALFVPGAASAVEYTCMLSFLKNRMLLVQKKGQSSVDTVSIPVEIVTTPEKAKPAPVVQIATPDYDSGHFINAVTDAVGTKFTATDKSFSGGSKANKILVGPDGNQYLFKYVSKTDKDNIFRPFTDAAAFKLCAMIKPGQVPVGVIEKDGQIGSIQPVVSDATPLSDSDFDTLSDEDKGTILAQHVADMFIGDHDGHFGNWLRVPGNKLVSIDKGQAFKFVLQGTKESLDPTWNAPGNFGVHLAKKLLVSWGANQAEIPSSAFKAMYFAIKKVESISDTQFDKILEAWGDKTGKDWKKVKTVLWQRHTDCLKDWTTVMEKLAKSRGEAFKWPIMGAVSYKPDLNIKKGPSKPVDPADSIGPYVGPEFSVKPEEVGIGKTENLIIKKAVENKWQGMTVPCDKSDIEDQQVMVKEVKYGEAPGVATLMHWRLSGPAAKDAKAELEKYDPVTITTKASKGDEPPGIPWDNWWPTILSGIITINKHISVTKDGKPNQDTIQKVKNILPDLQKLKADTEDGKGLYKNIPAQVVNSMANVYIEYCETIITMNDHAMSILGQMSEKFYKFVYNPEPEKEVKVQTSSVFTVQRYTHGKQPQSNVDGLHVVVKGEVADASLFGYSSHEQFVIRLNTIKGARISFNSPEGSAQSHYGQCWAIVPGNCSAALVAMVLKVFRDATKVETSVARPIDRQILFWSKQAAQLQKDSSESVQPSDGSAIVTAAHKKAIELYKDGKDAEALAALKKFVADRLSVIGVAGEEPKKLSVLDVEKLVKPEDYTGHWNTQTDANGNVKIGGFNRVHRIGWTREKLAKFFDSKPSKAVVIGHSMGDILSCVQKLATNNGSLLAISVRPYCGISATIGSGASGGGCDTNHGGDPVIYACMRRVPAFYTNHMYFDISLLLRTDVWCIDGSDSFGDTNRKRSLNPERWKELGYHNSQGGISASSSNQFNIKHDVDIRQYLWRAVFKTEKDRKTAIAAVHESWGKDVRFALNQTAEETFIVG